MLTVQFLSFFKFAIRFLSVAFFFAAVIIFPLHLRYIGKTGIPGVDRPRDDDEKLKKDPTYLWIYVIFPYLFTGMAVYLLIQQTNVIIQVRQKYLGSQTSTTDRTIRLAGIPPELRSEEGIKEYIESMQIGNVETVSLCRNWHELDTLMEERKKILRRLERAWTKHLGYKQDKRYSDTLPLVRAARERSPSFESEGTENSQLLGSENGRVPRRRIDDGRPKHRLWYGPLRLRYKKIDSIDYYEEKLRLTDEKIVAARQKDYATSGLAFVTMQSTAACQMAVQAILDPNPMQMAATLAPAPADVVWKNTYISRSSRVYRSWIITAVILFLTVFWTALLVPFVSLLNLSTLHEAIPGLADALARHPLIGSMVQTGLPTLFWSSLTVAVPYLYSCGFNIRFNFACILTSVGLSDLQGMTSRGDTELSLISKNFFFSFFNLFLIFTVLGSASNFWDLLKQIQDTFKDATTIAFALANSLENLSRFYINLIILQGLGLFPFRLLEFGSVIMYPINTLSARSPREYAEISTPPVFRYGFSIPQTILILVICIVYSVFPSSWLICLCGLVYFFIGHIIYKYQLLYAMDHQQHSTGRAWPMICSRVFIGLVFFQLAVIGSLALRQAVAKSLLLLPLLAGTVWGTYFFARTYEPLMKFIALRSIDYERPNENGDGLASPLALTSPPSGLDRDALSVLIGGREIGLRLKKYVNPNLSIPLEGPWIPSSDGSIMVRRGVYETE